GVLVLGGPINRDGRFGYIGQALHFELTGWIIEDFFRLDLARLPRRLAGPDIESGCFFFLGNRGEGSSEYQDEAKRNPLHAMAPLGFQSEIYVRKPAIRKNILSPFCKSMVLWTDV